MTNYAKLPTWADKDHVHAVVETPRGSRVKLEFDPKLGAFTLAKPLFAGLTYPYDWGFIPSTRAEDGDPLDVLIIHDAATYPGLVLRCTPVGVLEVEQSSKGKRERNDRVSCYRIARLLRATYRTSGDCLLGLIRELEAFFVATNALEAKDAEVSGMARPGEGHQDHQDGVNLSGYDAGPAVHRPGNKVRAVQVLSMHIALIKC